MRELGLEARRLEVWRFGGCPMLDVVGVRKKAVRRLQYQKHKYRDVDHGREDAFAKWANVDSPVHL